LTATEAVAGALPGVKLCPPFNEKVKLAVQVKTSTGGPMGGGGAEGAKFESVKLLMTTLVLL
jgi:hypothetical protein